MQEPISETQQREIFLVLVQTQDDGSTVSESRARIAAQYGIEVEQLLTIERTGVKANWPPLDITFPTPRFTEQGIREATE